MGNLYYYKHNPIVKKIFFAMLVPTILMNLTTALASFADTVIIGHYLDELSLSVVTYATPIYMIINTFAALFAVGGSISMSVDAGKGDKASSNRVFSMAIELILAVGILLLLAGIFFGEQITTMLGADAQVFDKVYDYSTIILVGAPAFMLNIGLAFFVRNDGRPVLSMVGMFLSIIVNIVFDIVFIGLLDLDVAGAAYATVLGQIVSVVVIASHFFSRKNTIKFKFVLKGGGVRIIKNGISTALHFVYQFVSILVLNHYVVSLAGAMGMVVYTVVFNLYTVSLALFEGLSQTVQPMVSLYYGEKSHKNIKNTLRLALIMTFVICGGITLALEIVPQVVPTVFGITESLLLEQSALAVRIFSTSMIIMTINVLVGYYLQSTEHSLMSSVLVSLRCCILFLGSAFILGKIFGVNGIWGAYTMAEALTFIIYIIMNRISRRRGIKKGIDADMLLLDRNIENKTQKYTFSCEKDDIDDYIKTISEILEKEADIEENIVCDAKEYINELKKCIEIKKDKYIETEINGAENKIIIRDNLDHKNIKDSINKNSNNGSKKEYSPVLGWNRICIERGN